jgi:heme-degrading monooxygenase HmoA
MPGDSKKWGYLLIWEFWVLGGLESEFEGIYGPQGEWARLFQNGAGYVRTELIRDADQPGRYLTLDYWTSQEQYRHFRNLNAERYHQIDKNCERLTERELQIGTFERIRAGPSSDD